jgi:hypothetical protein
VTLLLKEVVNGTELTVRMENFEAAEERDANKRAWQHGLTTLADILK